MSMRKSLVKQAGELAAGPEPGQVGLQPAGPEAAAGLGQGGGDGAQGGRGDDRQGQRAGAHQQPGQVAEGGAVDRAGHVAEEPGERGAHGRADRHQRRHRGGQGRHRRGVAADGDVALLLGRLEPARARRLGSLVLFDVFGHGSALEGGHRRPRQRARRWRAPTGRRPGRRRAARWRSRRWRARAAGAILPMTPMVAWPSTTAAMTGKARRTARTIARSPWPITWAARVPSAGVVPGGQVMVARASQATASRWTPMERAASLGPGEEELREAVRLGAGDGVDEGREAQAGREPGHVAGRQRRLQHPAGRQAAQQAGHRLDRPAASPEPRQRGGDRARPGRRPRRGRPGPGRRPAPCGPGPAPPAPR